MLVASFEEEDRMKPKEVSPRASRVAGMRVRPAIKATDSSSAAAIVPLAIADGRLPDLKYAYTPLPAQLRHVINLLCSLTASAWIKALVPSARTCTTTKKHSSLLGDIAVHIHH